MVSACSFGGFLTFISFFFSFALVGYQRIIVNQLLRASLALDQLIPKACWWNNRYLPKEEEEYLVGGGVSWGDVLIKIAPAKKEIHISLVKCHAQREFVCITNFAYGGCACSTSGSHNWAVLLKWHDSLSLYSHQKAMTKLLWPLLLFKSRILGLIWQATVWCVSTWTAQFLSHLVTEIEQWGPKTGDSFWRQIKSTKCFIFFTSTIR